VSQDEFDADLKIFLQFLRNNPDSSFTRDEITSSTHLSPAKIDALIGNTLANQWMDIESYNIGNPQYQRNEKGNRKLNRLTGGAASDMI